jgi:iduronate 2-sulfatase
MLLALLVAVLPTTQHVCAEDRPNVLLICVDDLRPELACFGQSYIRSPNIDALAAAGRAFHRHYVQAPTCGASRYTLLTGQYGPADNGALFARAKRMKQGDVDASLPKWFRQHGYTTVSVGKVSHHPGGRGGPDWDDPNEIEMPGAWNRHLHPSGPWQHPRGAMHGLAHGEIRIKASEMDVFQSAEGDDSIYPDGLTVDETLRQLQMLASDDRPFFLAVGIIRPHLPFGAPARYLEPYRGVQLPAIEHPRKPLGKTTWHGSGEFMKYNRWGKDPNRDSKFADEVRRHYAACVTYADAQVGRIMQQVRAMGIANNTIVVLWGDHGWHLGEHAIWGKHALFEESLRSPLVIRYEGLPQPGESSEAIVETLDLYPTLCDLAGLPVPPFVTGTTLRPILENPRAAGHPAISYTRRARSIRTDRFRLIAHGDGHAELYDHHSDEGETVNVANDHPDVVNRLREQLDARLQ